MYQDRDSIKVFERLHARDRMTELAHDLDHASSQDYDMFASHARAEAKDGSIAIVLSVALFAALVGLAALLWEFI